MRNKTILGIWVSGKRFSRQLLVVLAIRLLFASSLATATSAWAGTSGEEWVATWSTALHEPDLGVPGLASGGFNSQTRRQIVHTSRGGHQVRVRLSTFGAGSVAVGSAHVALFAAGSAIVPGSDRTLTFGGKPTITIPPGASVLS